MSFQYINGYYYTQKLKDEETFTVLFSPINMSLMEKFGLKCYEVELNLNRLTISSDTMEVEVLEHYYNKSFWETLCEKFIKKVGHVKSPEVFKYMVKKHFPYGIYKKKEGEKLYFKLLN